MSPLSAFFGVQPAKEKIRTALINRAKNFLKTFIKIPLSKKHYIKENDIIQEIILKHYLDNKKQTRKDILKTYFTNTNSKQKFRNKQEIENAIKSINDEMDEAQKEFSKLFISNDYTK